MTSDVEGVESHPILGARSASELVEQIALPRRSILRAAVGEPRLNYFGASYGTTLAEWRTRFLRAWPSIEALGFDASFKRLWEYYLCYCEAGFRTGRVDVGLFTVVHADHGGQPRHAGISAVAA